MKNTIQIIAGILMFLAPSVAGAQALPFISAETDAVSMGFAGAGVTETSEIAHSAFTNVAAVPFSDEIADFAAGYTMWQPSYVTSNIINVAGAYNISQKFGVALGLSSGIHQSKDIISESGAVKGSFRPSDLQLNAGFSWRFLPYMAVGVNLGYAEQTLYKEISNSAFATDIFLMSRFSAFSVAVGVSNFGTAVSASTGGTYYLPSSATLGAGYDKVFADKHGVDVNLDADYYWQTSDVAVAVGGEYTYDDLISVRAGYRYGGNSPVPSYASIGAGARYMGIKLNLAYVIAGADSPLSNTFSVGLGYSF